MRRLLPIAAIACCPLAGCATPAAPEPSDRVELLLYTVACPPASEPPFEQFVAADAPWTIAWTTRCTRDGRSVAWSAVKVSYWDDRAEDTWNLWYIDPTVSELAYGATDVPGIDDTLNDDYPEAWRRVPAVDPLPPGAYRVEIWAVQDDSLDAQTTDVKVTVLESA